METMAAAKEVQARGDFSRKQNKRFHCSYVVHIKRRDREKSFSSCRASAGFPKSEREAIWRKKEINLINSRHS